LEWASLTDEIASSDYSQKSLLELHRKSLQGQLGNLLSRISAPKILARLIEKDGASQSVTFRMPEDHVSSEALGSLLSGLPIQVDNYMQKFEVSKALEAIFEAIAAVSDLT
jgi:methionyl-tRNA synthetase